MDEGERMKIIEHPKGKHLPKNISMKKKVEILLASDLKVAKFSTYNEETKNFEDYYLPHFGDYTIGVVDMKTGFNTHIKAYNYGKKLIKAWRN